MTKAQLRYLKHMHEIDPEYEDESMADWDEVIVMFDDMNIIIKKFNKATDTFIESQK